VLFDNTYAHYLTPADIDAAMFGEPAIVFRTYEDGRNAGTLVTHGGDRKLTEQRRTYVSAVAVLERFPALHLNTITHSLSDT